MIHLLCMHVHFDEIFGKTPTNMAWPSELHEKSEMIKGLLAEGLYGHIFMPSGFWRQLDDYCDKYFPIIFEKIGIKDDVVQNIESVFTDHPLNAFPVAKFHQKDVIKWWQDTLLRSDKAPSPAIKALMSDDDIEATPNFIYKSLTRNMYKEGCTVTLFEENEIIGHGTTGLTSWQGALYLTDWLLANKLDDLQVQC